jgi:hypothetical protein
MGFLSNILRGASRVIGKGVSFGENLQRLRDRVVTGVRGAVGSIPVVGGLLNEGIETLMNQTPIGTALKYGSGLLDKSVEIGRSVANKLEQTSRDYNIPVAEQVRRLAEGNRPAAPPSGTERRMAMMEEAKEE